MLNIFFGDMPEAIYNTEVFFQNVYDDWIRDGCYSTQLFSG